MDGGGAAEQRLGTVARIIVQERPAAQHFVFEVGQLDAGRFGKLVVFAAHRERDAVAGRDYEFAKSTGIKLSNLQIEMLGCGPVLHNDPRDRPQALFGGATTIHLDPANPSYVLLPVIPPKQV